MFVLDVGQVTAYLRDLLETDPVMSDVWVRGEVTSFFRSAAGHCYFTLSNHESQLKCALFRHQQRSLLILPKVGDAVIAHGHVSIYDSQGSYQLYVDNVAPEGTGLLQLQFEELRRRLEQEGLFDPSRKRPLPDIPQRIGVVTSAQGAVWHDICTVIERRFPIVELVLAPSKVQGPDAVKELVRGLHALLDEGSCDVIIIGRGGGSPEDLAPFNAETLARAIFAASVPIVSAVGHETDFTIADLVADVRAPTPSAAAELVVPSHYEIRNALAGTLKDLRAIVLEQIRESADALAFSVDRVQRRSPTRSVELAQASVASALDRAERAVEAGFMARTMALKDLQMQSELLNPIAVLNRGYAIVSESSTAKRVTGKAVAERAGQVSITFGDGSVNARIDKEENHE